MVSVKELRDWLKQFPDDVGLEGEYWEKENSVDLKVITHFPGEIGCNLFLNIS
jgi:hypothetical protein